MKQCFYPVLVKDDYVEACAGDVNATVAMSSTTLAGPGHERIINESLHRQAEPPWGELGADEWRNRCALFADICRITCSSRLEININGIVHCILRV